MFCMTFHGTDPVSLLSIPISKFQFFSELPVLSLPGGFKEEANTARAFRLLMVSWGDIICKF